MVNEGAGGRWTRSLKEFEGMLARQPRADILVLALGTNDSADTSAGSVARTTQNIREMVLRGRQAYGRQLAVLVVGPPNTRTRAIPEQRDRNLRELGAAYSRLASELGCQFVSLYGVLPDASFASDGIHPDPSGNEQIVRVMLPKLLSMAGKAPR